MEKAYRNLGYILLLLIPLTILAFYKTYFAHFPTFADTKTNIHLHAAVASLWIIMLIAQPLLIRNKQYRWHRTLGKISYIIFPLLIISFVPQMIKLVNSEDSRVLFFPLADCIALILFYGLAIYHRRNVSKHMRYMIGTVLIFLGPILGRIGPFWFGIPPGINQNLMYAVIYLILAVLIISDLKNKRKYQPYLLIAGVWIAHQVVFLGLFLLS